MKIRTFLSVAAGLSLFVLTTGIAAGGSSVSVSVAPTMITDQGDEAIFTLTVSPPSSRELRVRIFLSGTAFPNSYQLTGNFSPTGQVVIPAGQSQSLVTLRSLGGDDPHPTATVLFDVAGLGSRHYRVGSPSRAKVTIQNTR